mmetsp:Transcript_42389/g.66372  ORF Transcript_42389/g.66372 Transcript_42389/m.66372 type:complete len:82 (-) Transcript_42389:463-708(-)
MCLSKLFSYCRVKRIPVLASQVSWETASDRGSAAKTIVRGADRTGSASTIYEARIPSSDATVSSSYGPPYSMETSFKVTVL